MKSPVTQSIGVSRCISAMVVLVMSLSGGPLTPGQISAQSDGFADPAFRRAWQRTDLPVAQSRVSRTWVWGPQPGRSHTEAFLEGPRGQHLVQYFDKARMEINNPAGNPRDPFYVTNGLLVVELISGRMQTGASSFENIGASSQRIAGDEGSAAPTYAALQNVASVGLEGADHGAAPLPLGSLLNAQYLGSSGVPTAIDQASVPDREIKVASYIGETGHNIPDVFWSYFNSTGPVYEDGAYVNQPLVSWVSAFGYPLTEPYWTSIRVDGRDRLVLFQAFQRRVLTYSPQNPVGWKVEMGNVGAQYYAWRYETPAPVCARVPVRGFGRVWAEHRNIQQGIGCPAAYPPFDKEQTVQTAYQPFENGAMLWVSRTAYVQERLIYVFFNDGTYQAFEDTWREGQPVSGNQTPPAGKLEPTRGFGKVWREGTGARVRERLGWATRAETGAEGAYQKFERGEMYWSGTIDNIWVLFSGATSPYPPPSAPFRYESHKDTFQP